MATPDELRAAQRAIVAALSQHAGHSYRASSAVVAAINGAIDQLARDLTGQLSSRLDNLTQAELQAFLAGKYTTPRLKALKAEIDGWGVALDQSIKTEWQKTAVALAGYEATFVADTMGKALDGLPKVTVKPEAIYKQAVQTPVFGKFVEGMMAEIAPDQVTRIYAAIRQGIQAGQSTGQIIRALRGTEALKYQDGLMQAAKRDVERLVRTARAHVSNVAYETTYEALGVKMIVWVAALEGRTCLACGALDGKTFKVGSAFAKPPIHPHCRCALAPALAGDLLGNRPFVRALKVRKRDGSNEFRSIGDMTKNQRENAGLKVGQVSAKTSYADWFANQDAAYQKEWLGPSRYKLYTDGKMPIDRFSDPLGKEYTLQDLRQRDAETFRAVFGDAM